MVLGFVVFWPLGLAMLAYILWGDRFEGFKRNVKRGRAGDGDGAPDNRLTDPGRPPRAPIRSSSAPASLSFEVEDQRSYERPHQALYKTFALSRAKVGKWRTWSVGAFSLQIARCGSERSGRVGRRSSPRF
jgi:hypothetical protein